MARRRTFSSAHFYHQPQFSQEKNLEIFGRCFTPHGHGHNYVLEVFIAGPIDPETRLIVNLTELDQVLLKVVDPLDHRHLNFDVPEFSKLIPTTENIAHYLRSKVIDELKTQHPTLRLQRLRLFETDNLWVEVVEDGVDSELIGKSLVLCQEVTLRAIHHLAHPDLSEKENKTLYGICYGEHGHHYKIQVSVAGAVDPVSGLLLNRDQFSAILQEKLVKPYDGADLNSIFPNTACEAIAIEFYKILKPLFSGSSLVRVGIQETNKNYFEFPAPGAAVGAADAGF